MNSDRERPAVDHARGICLRHGLLEQSGWIVTGCCAEQVALAILCDAGGIDVVAQFLGERVMARHLMLLATFLLQPELPAGTWAGDLQPSF